MLLHSRDRPAVHVGSCPTQAPIEKTPLPGNTRHTDVHLHPYAHTREYTHTTCVHTHVRTHTPSQDSHTASAPVHPADDTNVGRDPRRPGPDTSDEKHSVRHPLKPKAPGSREGLRSGRKSKGAGRSGATSYRHTPTGSSSVTERCPSSYNSTPDPRRVDSCHR